VSRLVICDTGPLIHLNEAGAFDLLKLTGGVLIPPAVADEFKRIMLKSKLPSWIHIRRLNDRSSSQVQAWVEKGYVDLGEAEAIGLAFQENSDWLLTDDAEAQQFAEGLGLEVHGSIGLLLWATASAYITSREQAYEILNGLERSSLWISARVLKEAAKAIDQLTAE
jgi:predicted nucleic acid-binding protein